MKEEVFDIAIVGGGIVGSATFYQLQKAFPTKKLVLIEKEPKLAHHQTGNNSGVIHSGLYYTPGSKKAENCVNGRHELVKFAKEHGINHDICGKVVVATSSSEISNLEKILDNGIHNNIEGIERINADQIKEIEPEVAGVDGIWVPCTGIIDFASVTERMIQVAIGTNSSSKVYTSTEVVNIEQGEDEKVISCKNLKIKSTFLIVCGGLQADRLAKIDQVNLKEKVVGFRGDYYEFRYQESFPDSKFRMMM